MSRDALLTYRNSTSRRFADLPKGHTACHAGVKIPSVEIMTNLITAFAFREAVEHGRRRPLLSVVTLGVAGALGPISRQFSSLKFASSHSFK